MESIVNTSSEVMLHQIQSSLDRGEFDTVLPHIISAYYECGKDLVFSDKSTPLHYACQHGNLLISQLLVTKYNLKIDSRNEKGFTPLHISALHGHLDIFMYLLNSAFVNGLSFQFLNPEDKLCNFLKSVFEEKLKEDHSDNNGNTVLHAACLYSSSVQLIKYLNQLGFNINTTNKDGMTCLQVAIKQGELEVIKYLLEETSLCNFDLHGRSLAYLAAQAGHLDVLKYLIGDKEVDCKLTVVCTEKSLKTPEMTLLHVACSEGHLDVVKYLIISCGLNLLRKDVEGRTPLFLACQNGHIEVLKCLIQLGSLSITEQGTSISTTKLCDSLKSLFQQNLITHHSDNDGNTPIHGACKHSNSVNVVQYLVQLTGFNFSSANKEGMTCLHVAAEHGCTDIVKYLLDQTLCDHSLVDSHGRSPAYIAAGVGHLDVLRHMIEKKGVDYQFKSTKNKRYVHRSGRTLLHSACHGGHIDVVRYLILKCGCDPSAKDDCGVTSLLLASRCGSLELVQFLIAADPVFGEIFVSCQSDKLCKALKSAFQMSFRKHNSCKGNTVLHLACKNVSDSVIVAEYFYEMFGFSPNRIDKDGMNCLHLAAACGNIKVVRYLLEKAQSDHTVVNSRGMSPTYLAAGAGHLHVLKYLIEEKGACSNFKTTKGWQTSSIKCGSGRTLVHTACREGHLDVVKYLVENCGCSPSVKDKENATPLYLACQQGHLEVVKYLVTLGCDIHEKRLNGRTCLHGASMSGQMELIKYLESFPISCYDCKDEHGVTPLHSACVRGNAEVISYLVSNWHCSLSSTSILGQSCLHYACLSDDFITVKFLIEDFNCSPLCKDNAENSLLHIVCTQGSTDDVDYLIKKQYCDPHARNVMGLSCVHAACSSGNVEVVMQLIMKYNCDPNCEDIDGITPIHLACSSGNLDVVKYLITQSHCDPNCLTNEGKSCLHAAICSQVRDNSVYSALNIVKYLVEDCSCNSLCEDDRGNTPLHIACGLGDLNTVVYLIEQHNCNPKSLDINMRSCFHDAISSSDFDLIRYLVESCNCDPSCADKQGVTPLHIACLNGNIEVVQYLIVDQLCNPNSVDIDNTSCLYAAVIGGCLNIIKYLTINHNCDSDCQDNKGVTPLHGACAFGYTDIVQYLLSLNCNTDCRYGTGRTCIHAAVSSHRLEAIKCFPKNHDFDSTDFIGVSPLHLACALGDLNIVRYLVHHHCDPNRRTGDGMSCLHIAVSSNNLDIVQYLISDISFDVNVKNEKGFSPVQIACGLGYSTIVQYLSSLKFCDLNCRSNDGRSCFHAAVTGLSLDVIKCLAKNSCDPMCKDIEGVTPLHIACAYGDRDIVEYLVLDLGCDPYSVTVNGASCLGVATSYGNLEIIKFFLEVFKYDINLDAKFERPMLFIACAGGHLDIVKYLISHHQYDSKCVNIEGRSCLHAAAINGKLDVVKYLIEEQDYDPSCLADEGFTPLYASCQFGHLEVVQYLVNYQQCDPKLSTFKGRSCLHSAVISGNMELVKYLVEDNNCDPNYEDTLGITPLHLACARGQMHIVSYFILVQQCDPNHRSALKGYSCLHAAAISGNKDIIVYLLEDHNCDPNCTDDEGMTPLHIACEGGYVKIIEYLLTAHCCDPNQRTIDGRTCLHSAIIGCDLKLIHLFTEVGKCDPHSKTKYGVTPLHIACELGRTDVADYLISCQNCDPNDKAANGWSSYHYAASRNNVNVIKYLFKDNSYDPTYDNKAISPLYLTFLQELMQNEKYLSHGDSVTTTSPTLSFLESAASLCHDNMNSNNFSGTEGDLNSKRRQLNDIYQRYVQKYRSVNQINSNVSPGKSFNDAEFYKYSMDTTNCFEEDFGGQEYSPLHLACRQGFIEVVKYLISTKHYDPRSTTADGRSCLHYAASSGSLATFKYLIEEHNCDPNCADNEGFTPIHFACTKGLADMVEYFISLNASNHAMHLTLFHIALRCGHLDLIQYFISALQCDPNGGSHFTPLHIASENGYLNIVTCLVEKHHCDPLKKSANLDTPHHAAAKNGQLEVVKYFIEHIGVDPSPEGEAGNTPLHYAVDNGNLDVVNYLLNEAHCNLSCRDHNNQTPLHHACGSGDLEMVKGLCRHIIFTNEPLLDGKNNSPLHIAAANGRLNVAKYLMGCDDPYSPQLISNPNTKNHNGNTPVDEARHHNHNKVFQYLDKATQHCSLSHTSIAESTKTLVLGSPKAGKSTLIKALSEDKLLGRILPVQEVKSTLSGSVSPDIERDEFGKISVFRFTGDTDYFITHEYILQRFNTPLILLVVNLALQLQEIERQLSYWKHLLLNFSICRKMNVIVVGSHADNEGVKNNMESLQSRLHQMIPFGRNVNGVSYYDFVCCDCRFSGSGDMKLLRQLIGTVKKQSCLPLSDPERRLPLLSTSLLAYLIYLSRTEVCITLLNLHHRISELDGRDGKLMILSQKEKLHEICMYLKSSGHLLYLEHSSDYNRNTIVLNDKGLLENLHASLQEVQSHLDNDFGVLEESKLNEILSSEFSSFASGQGVAIKCLYISQLYSTVSKEQLLFDVGEALNESTYYYFPDLVRSSCTRPRSSKLWVNSSKLFTWFLVCEKEDQYFTPRFIRLLFCKLIQKAGDDAGFMIWKNGVLLVHHDVTRCMIELTDRNTKLQLVMQCSSQCEINLILLRSKLIALIRSVIQRISPELDLTEYFLLPQEAGPLPVEIRLHTADIASALLSNHHEIFFGNGKGRLALSDILVFDIFQELEGVDIRSIIDSHNSTHAVSPVILQKAIDALKKLPNSDREVKELESISIQKDFYHAILKYTVFTGGNILVSID